MRRMHRRAMGVVATVLGMAAGSCRGGSLLNVPYGVRVLQEVAQPQTYMVKSGDTLWGIAEKFFGNGLDWHAIFGDNTDIIKDPDLIFPGELIRIPAGAKGGDFMGRLAGVTSPRPAPGPASGPAPVGDSGALDGWKGGKLPAAQFFSMLGPAARESQKRTGVPAAVTLAQAALETGYGESSIGDAHNLFGMKGTGPAGTSNVATQEFENGHYVTIHDGFKKYHSWQESIDDHAALLSTASRYHEAMVHKDDPDRFAQEIARGGYATDPSYAAKLIQIMKENNLYRWDQVNT